MSAAVALAMDIGVPLDAAESVGFTSDPDWHARRRKGIGSSEIAMVLGRHPKHGEGGPAVLWAIKTGHHEPEDLDGLEFIRWGNRMERVIIEAYGTPEYSGREVRASGEQFRSRRHPWAQTTLDGWTRHPKHGWIPLEVKNVGAHAVERWLHSAPIEMWWQCQMHSFVLGAPAASLAACIGGASLMWEDIPADADAHRLIATKGAEFWRCVQENRVPLHVPTLASVRALYQPGEESGTVQLSGDEWADLDADLRSAKEDEKDARTRREQLEAKLCDAIGNHECAVLDDGTTYTRRTQSRKQVTIPASSFRVLRRKKTKGAT